MSSALDSIIQLGQDITAYKIYALSAGTVLFYDYLLTLPDEVNYVWPERKRWTFWVFMLNRYFPMTWQFWRFVAQILPPIPLDAYRLCTYTQNQKSTEVAYTSLSLLYDALAFMVIIFQARRSRVPGLKVSNILNTIAEDSTRYFIVIFTSHFVLVMTLNLGRVTIQFLPGAGILVYLPLMISRIMLSLKKAADSTRTPWSLTQDTWNGNAVRSGLVFGRPPGRGPIEDEDTEISLDTFQEP
ncbi:hypothetical protein BJ322DRAFT_1106879 [Thelephora terrestris]|uniref:DUF6533 domain-containing protein n=1 Tax=Thelephora terrestris TaxID=56493 RepID=A0A9P6HGF2_9AGAM|nr:hypothetical protein BJ322DRAFT_1106879 [Thelephora terrestris]